MTFVSYGTLDEAPKCSAVKSVMRLKQFLALNESEACAVVVVVVLMTSLAGVFPLAR